MLGGCRSHRQACEALPRDKNGDIDRPALLRLRPGGAAAKEIQASGDIKIRLVGLWQSMLKVPVIGVMDNFFEMGGHSLLAARMFSPETAAPGQQCDYHPKKRKH